MIGASFDTPADNAAFKQKFSYPFPLLCDTNRGLAIAYGACSDAQAKYPNRITVVIGKDGKVVKVYPKVAAKTHPDEVLKDLQA